MDNLLKEKNGQPLVSFIIACYDLPITLLRECIESIRLLSLGEAEREIILVDDGSHKSPLIDIPDLVSEIIYIRQRNMGLSAARNAGLQMAQGRFVQFVDGDDYLIHTPYEHCLDLIRNDKADMVLFDFTHEQQENAPAAYEDLDVMTGVEYMRQHNLRGMACGYLFKRSILGELRFTLGTYHEDEEFTPQLLLRAEKVCATNAVAYYYRVRDNSIITTTDTHKQQQRRTDMKAIIQRLSVVADRLPAYERLALQRRVHQLTMDFVYNLIFQTRSYDEVCAQLEDLRNQGLFPLPDRDYTMKYRWFRRMSSCSWGLRMLVLTLPRLAKER